MISTVEIEQTIVSSGGITAILKALDTFATDSTIQEAGCIALHNLCAKSGSFHDAVKMSSHHNINVN